jgi:hypothetical protein
MSIKPEHLQIKQPIIYDNSIVRSEIIEVYPACGLNQANLNSADSQLRFILNSENRFLHLASSKTGFRIRVGYITRAGVHNDRNAKCTLVSNWANHLFSSAKFNLCGTTIEHVQNLGIATDILLHLRGEEFRKYEGDIEGFIPDTGNGTASDVISNTPTFVAGGVGDGAGIVDSLSNKSLTKNTNYNEGFEKRLRIYNYRLAHDNDVRYAEAFIPLKSIFSFCDEYNRVLKYINFEIELIRQANNQRIYFGAVDTSLAFGDPNTTGLLNIVLEIESITPNPQLSVELDNELKEPIHIAFLERTCINRVAGQSQTWDVTETRFTAPRYVFIVNYQGNRNLFPHSDINYIQVVIDGEVMPNLQQGCRFLENRYTKFYQSFKDVCKYFDTGTSITMREYADLYTIFAIDVSNQKDKIKGTNSNMSIRVHRNAIPAGDDNRVNPQNAEYYIVILQEKHIKLNCLTGMVETILI